MLNEKGVIRELSRLPHLHQIAFGASCCERMLPDYYAFWQTEGWGDFSYLESVLNRIWRYVSGDDSPLESCLNRLTNITPDTEDFSTIYVSLAVNSVSAIAYTIESCLNPSEGSQKIALVSDLMFDSLFSYLLAVNYPFVHAHIQDQQFSESIFEYPLMSSEKLKQLTDLRLLEEATDLSCNSLLELRDSSRNIGIRAADRGLFKSRSTQQE
jgi:uncharacterized protein